MNCRNFTSSILFTIVLSSAFSLNNVFAQDKVTQADSLDKDQLRIIDSILKSNNKLQEVVVTHKSPIDQVKESPFNVAALDAKQFYNTTTNLNDLLNKASGVRIREIGGVGSNTNISLNGFTGRHVKVFIDGVPMQGMGTSFGLNNIPLGIADRIEVYKGVVPVEFGGDAMGGVVDIVTKKTSRTYIDASYSYGSFNTHKGSVDVGYTSKTGFTAQLTGYQNYSDNNYKVFTQVLDLNTGMYSENNQWVKRFNDSYNNQGLIGKVGFINKKWADRLMLTFTMSQERADIQNANIMRIVYGDKWRKANTVMPSLTYTKRDLFTKGLNVNLTANYSYNLNNNYDTASKQYNWLGEYRNKSTAGEGMASMSEFTNKTANVIANINYTLAKKHRFVVNNTFTTFERSLTQNALAGEGSVSAADTIDRTQSKNILSGSYQYLHNKNFNVNVFAKHYSQNINGPVDTSSVASTEKWALKNSIYSITGYGLATTYIFNNGLQAKLSYERGMRLPTEGELFGDGVLERGTANLRAEYSHNINLGFTLNKQINKDNAVYADVSFMYRDINDYIRREVNDQRYGSAYYFNFGRVSNKGINVELQYYYKGLLSIGGNVTYQELINEEKYRANSTVESNIYKDRVPNVPYFFGNTDVSVHLKNVGAKGNNLTLTHNLIYTHEFFVGWPSLGSKNSKDRLPTQISQDIIATYTMKNGMYNVSVEGRNITDVLLYDNFSLQRPGRSFSVKLRYFFSKNLHK